MEHLTDKDLLILAFENGIINMDDVQKQFEMNERKRYLEMHKNEIWQGKDNGYYTYLPDEMHKNGRRLIRKSVLENLQDEIIKFYKTEEDIPTINKVYKMWVNEKLEFGEIRKSTYDRYELDFKRYFVGSILDQKNIRYITEDYLEVFIRKTIVENNLTVKSYSNFRTLIYGIFKYAKRKKLISFSISTFFKDLDLSRRIFRKNIKSKEKEVFSEEEVIILMDWLRKNPSIENYGVFVELAPNLAGLAELRDSFCSDLNTGDTVAVYIKSIIPDKMKIKLVIVDAGGERASLAPPKYFIDKRTEHISYWKYSPPAAPKLIETFFE